jgi:hypothetical protein
MQEFGRKTAPRMKQDLRGPVPNQNEWSGRSMMGEYPGRAQLEGYRFPGCGNLLIQCDFFARVFSDVAPSP